MCYFVNIYCLGVAILNKRLLIIFGEVMRLKDILREMKAIEKLRTMSEMALKNTGLVGDFSKDASFKGADRKIHLGKNRVSQLKNFFKNTEIDFNIVFFNSPIYRGYSGLCFSTEPDLIAFLKYRMQASEFRSFKYNKFIFHW
jgi:hypothetical protein